MIEGGFERLEYKMRNLDHDWEVSQPTIELFDTIRLIGGVKGLIGLSLLIFTFIIGVEYYIKYKTAQRKEKKSK